MSNALHILVTCTKRKTRPPLAGLAMGDVGGQTVARRLDRWLERLRAARGPRLAAGELYAGDHWRVCRELCELGTARGFRPRLWVVSAGYGLIESNAMIHPYSAAFSPGHVDSVLPAGYGGPAVTGFAEWWAGMAKWAGPQVSGAPRTIASLLANEPSATVLVVASELYLKAVWADLVAGAADPGRAFRGTLAIVSAGTKDFGPLADFALPVDARLQRQLGGARRSLNVRMARLALSWMRPGVDLSKVRDACAETVERAGVPERELRRPACTDAEVVAFIKEELRGAARPSAASFLRLLRDERGRACEQKRFSRLFRQVTSAVTPARAEVARA